MRLLEAVVAADQAGQHAGIRRVRLARDQRQAHAGLRPHGEAAQHLDMRVAGAQQDEVGRDRAAGLHSPSLAGLRRVGGAARMAGMTWSILVRDPATGALGAAVATRFFAVGALCDPCRGRRRGARHAGADQPDVCGARHAAAARRRGARRGGRGAAGRATPGRDHRQLHMIDAAGRIAQHTGAGLRRLVRLGARRRRLGRRQHAGRPGRGGDARWRRSSAPPAALAERLLTALEAGEAAGGDKRGKQSAALKDLHARSVSGSGHPHRRSSRSARRTAPAVRVSLERFAVFRRFLPGTDSPCGVFDRDGDRCRHRAGGPPTRLTTPDLPTVPQPSTTKPPTETS